MARRPKPLDPNGSPTERFALNLRALRDSAGADAPTIEDLAIEGKASRSAMYKAIGGNVVPSRGTLAVLVTAWGGDVATWMKRRSALEAEVELQRHLAGSCDVHTLDPDSEDEPLPDMFSIFEDEGPATGIDDVLLRDGEDPLVQMKKRLNELVEESGKPSLRKISAEAKKAGAPVSVSTIHNTLNPDQQTVPTRETVRSIMTALSIITAGGVGGAATGYATGVAARAVYTLLRAAIRSRTDQ
ncbi:hypothetical protein [Nocardia sp. NPDC004722]